MPTPEQIERAARALIAFDGAADIFSCTAANEVDRLTLGMQAGVWCHRAMAAISAAAPTPEEHERGIEAAILAYDGAMNEMATDGDDGVRAAVASYLAAVGLAP